MSDIKRNLPLASSHRLPTSATPLQRTTSSGAVSKTTQTPEASQARFEAQMRHRSDSTSSLPTTDEMRSATQALETVPSQELSERASRVPAPAALLQAREKIMAQSVTAGQYTPQTPMQVKDGLAAAAAEARQDTQTLGVNMDSVSNVKVEVLNTPDLKKMETTYQTELGKMASQTHKDKALSGHLTPFLKPRLKALSEANSGSTRDAKIKAVNDQVKKDARALVASLGTDDELSILMRMGTQKDLKESLAGIVGELRNGKKLSYDQLSPRKQAFVDQMASGIQMELGKQAVGIKGPRTPLAVAQSDLRMTTEREISNLSKPERTQLALMDDKQLAAFLTPRFGANAPLMATMTKGISEVLSAAAKVETKPERVAEQVVKPLQSADLIGQGVADSMTRLAANPGNPADLADASRSLQRHIQRLNPNHNTIWQLSLMTGEQIGEQLKPLGNLSDSDRNALVATIQRSLPNQAGDLAPVQGKDAFGRDKTYQVPSSLTLGGKVYHPEKFLAAAGNGAVLSFVSGGERVAVKVALDTDPELRGNVVNEINTHRELQGKGSEHIIGLKGAVSSPDGTLYIVQEFAGGGDIGGLSDRLDQAQSKGLITPETRQLMGLYVLKQSLQGLDYMQSERQMMHLDYKPENMMIGNDGNIKMIDFGTSLTGTQTTYERDQVDAYYNRSPERMGNSRDKTIDQSADTWGVGVMAYKLLVGDIFQHKVYDHKFASQGENAVRDFGTDADNRLRPSGQLADGSQGLGVTAVDKLVNGLMMPNAEQRTTPKEALKSALLQDPRLDDPAMKALFVKLAQPLNTVGTLTDDRKLELRFAQLKPELDALGLA
ncbi:MAG: protein kinase domain-containing protein [Candidatus Sericytochromatia bacterium]